MENTTVDTSVVVLEPTKESPAIQVRPLTAEGMERLRKEGHEPKVIGMLEQFLLAHNIRTKARSDKFDPSEVFDFEEIIRKAATGTRNGAPTEKDILHAKGLFARIIALQADGLEAGAILERLYAFHAGSKPGFGAKLPKKPTLEDLSRFSRAWRLFDSAKWAMEQAKAW